MIDVRKRGFVRVVYSIDHFCSGLVYVVCIHTAKSSSIARILVLAPYRMSRHPSRKLERPPGGARTREVGRPVRTLPEFIRLPDAYALLEVHGDDLL